jgi:hypothetical protein
LITSRCRSVQVSTGFSFFLFPFQVICLVCGAGGGEDWDGCLRVWSWREAESGRTKVILLRQTDFRHPALDLDLGFWNLDLDLHYVIHVHHYRLSAEPLSTYTRELDFHHPLGPILQFPPVFGDPFPRYLYRSSALTLARRKRAESEDER